MTSPTRPARCTGRPGGTFAALLGTVLLASAGGCGSMSRAAETFGALATADAAQLAVLRGREPLMPEVWLASAGRAETPEEALAYVQRGLEFRPSNPQLLSAQTSLLAALGRSAAVRASVESTLAFVRPGGLEGELRALLVDAALAEDDLELAELEARRLAAVEAAPRPLVAQAFARIATAYAAVGEDVAADRLLEASLDLGPGGLSGLRGEVSRNPERTAAVRLLVERAVTRHPDNPDLRLFIAVDVLARDGPEAAADVLTELPRPLPARLVLDVALLEARVAVLQGHVDEGLADVLALLSRAPGDGPALLVLLECKQLHDRPGDEQLLRILEAARGRIRDRFVADQVGRVYAGLSDAAAAAGPDAEGQD